MSSIESLKATVKKFFWCQRWAPDELKLPKSVADQPGQPEGNVPVHAHENDAPERLRLSIDEGHREPLPSLRSRACLPPACRDLGRSEPRYGARLPVFISLDSDRIWSGFSSNLSTGGILVEMLQPLPPDTVVSLVILFRGAVSSLRCRGRVVWLEEGQAGFTGKSGEMGIQFLDLTPAQKGLLQTFIEQEGLDPLG